MNNLTGLKFYFNEDLNLVIDDYRGKTVSHKVISPNTFAKLLEKNIEISTVQTGILPERCVAYRENHDGTKYVVIDVGRFRINLIYENTTYENFPIPRLLFGFFIDKDFRITGVKVAVADMGTLRDDTRLYKYPFSNVQGFDMCTGSNTMPKLRMLRQLNGIPNFIFSMPDNNDYYKPDRTKLNMEYRNMLEFLKDKDEKYYYDNVLISTGKTLTDFINYKIGG